MLIAKVRHRYNNHDNGLYMFGGPDSTFTYFHHTGIFCTSTTDDFVFTRVNYESSIIWINILFQHLYRYQNTPTLKNKIIKQIDKLKSHQNMIIRRRQDTVFKLPSTDTCPICLIDIPTNYNVYSYHGDHQLHWACPSCFRQHHRDGIQPCPICRLPH